LPGRFHIQQRIVTDIDDFRGQQVQMLHELLETTPRRLGGTHTPGVEGHIKQVSEADDLQIGISVAQRSQRVTCTQSLQAHAHVGKEIDPVARREEDLERILCNTLVVTMLARMCRKGSNAQICHIVRIVRLAHRKLLPGSPHVLQGEPLGNARTIHAQPLEPLLFRPHEHRFDVPQGIIEIESNGAKAVQNRHMDEFHLIIGNKNYSSWSLRPWIFMTHLGVRFSETIVPLDTPEFKGQISRYSPTERVPVLQHGELTVWDSLAICEYVAEVTGRGLPAGREARAVARSVCAEMHSGFATLRADWPMIATARNRQTPMSPDLEADIRRIDRIWSDCRARFGRNDGPWLFGEYSMADAMYAPVVLRFNTYGANVAIGETARAYIATALQDLSMQQFLAAARDEPWRLAKYEGVTT
jgi:glutathione S-transferase